MECPKCQGKNIFKRKAIRRFTTKIRKNYNYGFERMVEKRYYCLDCNHEFDFI